MTAWLKRLAETPEIDHYVELFPRLDAGHLTTLFDAEVPPQTWAAALRNAAQSGPLPAGSAADFYNERGEPKAGRKLQAAHPELQLDWNEQYSRWRRQIQSQLLEAEERALLCDREGVSGAEATWAASVRRTTRDLEDYAEIPACGQALIERVKRQMDAALSAEKGRLQAKIGNLRNQLQELRSQLLDDEAAKAERFLEHASSLVSGDDFVVGCRRIAQAERVLKEGRCDDSLLLVATERLPLARRLHPGQKSLFRLSEIVRLAGQQLREFNPELAAWLPNETICKETQSGTGFIARHASPELSDWGGYFKELRIWLGVQEKKEFRPTLSLLRANSNNFWTGACGKADFLFAQPWHGAPFFEAAERPGKIVAFLRPVLRKLDLQRPNLIEQTVTRAIEDLWQQAKRQQDHTDDREFADQGLVIAMLPGDFLNRMPYRQWVLQARIDSSVRNRVAFIDELDLLRVLRLGPDERLRGLLQVALPRFLSSQQETYQHANAVGPRMFFGREDEMRRLESDGRVVFSGRRMGKSSLLMQLRAQCRSSSDRRAVFIGCAGIQAFQSWQLLQNIARSVSELMQQEGIENPPRWEMERLQIVGDKHDQRRQFEVTLERVKSRFHEFLAEAVPRLKGRGFRRLFVLLDEVDSFAKAEWVENAGASEQRAAVSWFLRDRESESDSFLRFVFAGFDELGLTDKLSHSAFGNWGSRIDLKPLDERDARKLIVEPLSSLGMLIDQDLADRILDFTSGHAGLIQLFCGRLIETVRNNRPEWPLEDVTPEFQDVRKVAESQDYQTGMALTLEQNLRVARNYPLELVFFGLVSPTGLGGGKQLSLERFSLPEVERQIRDANNDSVVGSDQLHESLKLLAQLGLLERLDDAPSYRFRARHFANYLRTQHDFQDRLKRSREAWCEKRDQDAVIPRYVWTMPNEQFLKLYEPTSRVTIVCGLERSGRENLAALLEQEGRLIDTRDPEWPVQFAAARVDASLKRVIVLDHRESVPWDQARVICLVSAAAQSGPVLRWISGSGFAWNLCNDPELLLQTDYFAMGSLTPSELDNWAARDAAAQSATVSAGDRPEILRITGGLPVILEAFRTYLRESPGGVPEPIELGHAEEFRRRLRNSPRDQKPHVQTLARGMPSEMREQLQQLFQVCRDYDTEQQDFAREELDYLRSQSTGPAAAWSTDEFNRLLDAARLIGVLQPHADGRSMRVPHDSILGDLILSPAFREQA